MAFPVSSLYPRIVSIQSAGFSGPSGRAHDPSSQVRAHIVQLMFLLPLAMHLVIALCVSASVPCGRVLASACSGRVAFFSKALVMQSLVFVRIRAVESSLG